MKSGLHACAHHSTSHHVNSQQDEHSRNSASDFGDFTGFGQRILFNAMKNMSEKVDNTTDILSPRSLKTGWSTALNKGDITEMANLQQQLEAAKDKNNKATALLEHVLVSNNKMRAALHAAQTELKQKDTEISNLKNHRTQTQQQMQVLETELEHFQARLVAMGKQHSSQMEPLCKALENARTNNKTLGLRLEEVLQVSTTLQSKLTQTQCELKSQETGHQQLLVCREQSMEKAKTDEKIYDERVESLKEQFQSGQEASGKAACQECAEMKKSLEESFSRLAEVSRENMDLQQKLIGLEERVSSYEGKLTSQRAQIRHYLAYKAKTERVKGTESELRKMEAMKEEYQKNNYEQLQYIQKLASELKSVQSELQALQVHQRELQVQNRQLETQLEAERRQRQQLGVEYQKLKKTNEGLKKYKAEAKKKPKEASTESKQGGRICIRITTH